jgi:hypothetical protein
LGRTTLEAKIKQTVFLTNKQKNMSQQSKLIQTKVLADQTKVSEQCNGWRGEEEKEERRSKQTNLENNDDCLPPQSKCKPNKAFELLNEDLL